MVASQHRPAPPRPVLVLMVGPPGTGKSRFARHLSAAVGAVHVQSDALRKEAFPEPRYTPAEHEAVFRLGHRRLRHLLTQGTRVVFDATNLLEGKRRELYRIAEESGAGLVIVRTCAPESIVAERMAGREVGRDVDDVSDAGWDVYLRMRRRVDPIPRPHFVVNTAVSWEAALQRVVAEVSVSGSG